VHRHSLQVMRHNFFESPNAPSSSARASSIAQTAQITEDDDTHS
jgi:hypothetical protein